MRFLSHLCLGTKAIFIGLAWILLSSTAGHADELEAIFQNPPPAAKPQVLWMWMGGAVSSEGITRDLEALKEEGFGGATMVTLSDTCTPWSGVIANTPAPQAVAFTEPWWKLVKQAASESRRLGLDFGIYNCPGYESSGGPWIAPEFSMQEIVWSETRVKSGTTFSGTLERVKPKLAPVEPFPVFDPAMGKAGWPDVPARRDFYRDVAVLALPADGVAAREKIIDLTGKMSAEGRLEWTPPAGDWIIYRFGRTTMGALIQPCQPEAIGLECDKMSREAVEFHMNQIVDEAKRHLGDLVGNGFSHCFFDSYEAGTPGWTPRMREEFSARRGYDLTPFLPTLAKRVVGSEAETRKFQADFDRTIRDLYRDNYFPTIQRVLNASGLAFMCEPYGGPWEIAEAVPSVDRVTGEFWTEKGAFAPNDLAPTIAAARAAGRGIIEAEALTGQPRDSQWTETPGWLKPIGDAAFCAGVNRLVLHRFVHQPFDDRWRPGVTMGQWGSHFDRTQTWWKPGKAWVSYLARCEALLQWGELGADKNDFSMGEISGKVELSVVHRQKNGVDVFFVANLARSGGGAKCSFAVSGRQPELWNPVTGERRDLSEGESKDGRTIVPLEFAAAESCFVVFRRPSSTRTGIAVEKDFAPLKAVGEIAGAWQVSFDPAWGGPKETTFAKLVDWTRRAEEGIKYYSGTAVYTKTFDLPDATSTGGKLFLDLGTVRDLAEVRLNGKNLGVVWTAPWRVEITGAVQPAQNKLEIEVTNVWANRLIGDERQPPDCEWGKGDQGYGGPLKKYPDWLMKGGTRPSEGRFTFTTWNYFTKDSPLSPSGLLGPVRLMRESR